MFLIGRASGLIARPRPPRGVLSVRAVRTAPASGGSGVVNRSALEGGGGGRDGQALGRPGGGWCGVKYGETEAEGCSIGIKSDTQV